MMLRLAPLALLAAGCATTPATQAPCAVKIDFGSYCCGVDGETKAAVERYLEGARGVTGSTSNAWGREAESTRCVVTRSRADTDRIYRDLAALIPPTARRGPVTVTTADGRATPTQTQR
jgi:dihydrodipicolinate synthase/N-acetylneuraminate lyase